MIIKGKNIFLTSTLQEKDGDRIWCASPIISGAFREFTIYTNVNTGQFTLKFFRCKYKTEKTKIQLKYISEAVTLICLYLADNTDKVPFFRLRSQNDPAYSEIAVIACERAGLRQKRRCPPDRLYWYGRKCRKS